MAVILAGGCRVSEMREGAFVEHGTLRIWNQIGRATGAHAISLRVLEFAPGLSTGIRNDQCDEILFVLDGSWAAPDVDPGGAGESSQGQVRSAPPPDHDSMSRPHPEGVRGNRSTKVFIDGHNYDLNGNTGIYIRPGQTLAINNSGLDPIVLISSQCPDPDSSPKFLPPLTAVSNSIPAARPPIVRLADSQAQPTANRWYRVLVDDEVGSTQATQFVGSIPPGRAPDHFHNYEEVLFILKGEGRMWAGDTSTPIGSGSCIYLPKGQVHCVENTGTDELRLLGVFYPAGSPSVRYET